MLLLLLRRCFVCCCLAMVGCLVNLCVVLCSFLAGWGLGGYVILHLTVLSVAINLTFRTTSASLFSFELSA